MSGPAFSSRVPPSPSPWTAPSRGLHGLLAGVRRRLLPGSRAAGPAGRTDQRPEDPLLAVGQRLQQARLARGLGLRQLADETRISTPVLEALERGWRERLPEAAYLRTMLPLLEVHLRLEPGSLEGALPRDRPGRIAGAGAGGGLRRFTPGSIDVFTSWEGTLLYGLLSLALLLALNRQQRALVQQGAVAGEPLAAAAAPLPGRQAEAELLQAFPELRPLARAAAGQALPLLRREGARAGAELSPGRLQLQLPRPARISLDSRAGAIRLQAASGALELPLLPPFSLRLEPASAEVVVRWNGRPLAPASSGRYRYPSAAAPAAPAAARPSRAAMAP